jgi:hypothetical protein
VFALKQLKSLAYSNVGITDGIYGKLVEDDVHNLVSSLGAGLDEKQVEPKSNAAEMAALIKKLEENPDMLALLTKLLE